MGRTAYELPEGRVYVDVLAAIERDDYCEGERRRLVLPALRVTTYTGYDHTEFLTLRGKRYSIDHIHVKTPPEWKAADWTTDSVDYMQRYTKTEAGNSLDWRSPTGARLSLLEQRVRDRFVAEHPEWERVSRTLRLDYQIRHAQDEAMRLKKALAEKINEAAELRRQRAELQGFRFVDDS